MNAETNKLQSVQVFRGAAALLVLLFHATGVSKFYFDYELAGGLFLFGYSGVDFFFVLSGFIIFLTHHGEAGRAERLRPYLIKRLIRIYPLYWIVAVALAPIYFGAPHHARDFIVLLKSFLLLPQIDNPVVTVAWSLSHELFFYGMFGLAIYFPWRHVRPLLIVWLLISALFYLGKVLTNGTIQLPPHTGFVFSSYNLEFAMGCAAAYLLGRDRQINGRRLAITGLTIFLLCGLSEGYLYQNFGRRHSPVSYGLSSMLLVWGATVWERRNRIVMPSFLLLLGDASYSIYLTHYALLNLFAKGLRRLNIPALIGYTLAVGIIIALTLSFGVLFYLYVERPLLARLRKQGNILVPGNNSDGRLIAKEDTRVFKN